MICEKCGKEISNQVSYCPECGAKIEKHAKTIQLKCKSCGGIMEVNPNSQEVTCPFCGNKEKILESDEVIIEKVKANTYKEVEFAKMSKEEKQDQKKQQEQYKKSKLHKFTIIAAILCILVIPVSFQSGHILAGIIALIQTCLFIASWLMGIQVIKEKKNNLHMVLFALGLILILPFGWAYNKEVYEKMDWPNSGIVSEIPQPKSKYGTIYTNDEDSFYANVEKTSESDYQAYVSECKEKGFTQESEEDSYSYTAFNEEGYELNIDFYSDSMTISLDAPEEMETIQWPTSELVNQLPKPKSMVGKINYEHESSFSVNIGKTSKDDYKEYVNSVSNAGFTVDYDKGDTYYSAKNASGYSVSIRYKGNNVMSIEIEEPEEKEESTTNEDTSSQQQTQSQSQTTTSNVKETMDSYEAFMDQYIAFMQKYENSDDTVSMLTDYTNMMSQYADFAEKVDALDTDSMSEEDYAYYMEVMTRVNTKLMNAAI